MPGVTELHRTCLHETGHVLMARAFGWDIGALTVTPGRRWAGCADLQPVRFDLDIVAAIDTTGPVPAWPEEIRRRLEGDVMVLLAGETAEKVLTPATEGRHPDTAAETAAATLATLPPVSDDDKAWALTTVDNLANTSDEAKITRTLAAMFGSDLASANAFLNYSEAQCRRFVTLHASDIRRIAAVAEIAGTLSGAAVARLLDAD